MNTAKHARNISTARKVDVIERVVKNLMDFMQGSVTQLGESIYKVSLTQAALIEHLDIEDEIVKICERIETERKEAYDKAQAESEAKMAEKLDQIVAQAAELETPSEAPSTD